jgi:HEAT repeat protein
MLRPRTVATFLAVLLSFVTIGTAQNGSAGNVSQLLQQLQSPSWESRSTAFYALLDLGAAPNVSVTPYDIPPKVKRLLQQFPTQADEIKLALIALLALENPNIQLGYQAIDQPSIAEDQTEYYADLGAAVSSLNDPRAISSLVGAVLMGNIVTSALASFGDPAVHPLILQITTTTDDLVQFSSLFALERMLDPQNFQKLSPQSLSKLQRAFRTASHSLDAETASEARTALAKLKSLAPDTEDDEGTTGCKGRTPSNPA